MQNIDNYILGFDLRLSLMISKNKSVVHRKPNSCISLKYGLPQIAIEFTYLVRVDNLSVVHLIYLYFQSDLDAAVDFSIYHMVKEVLHKIRRNAKRKPGNSSNIRMIYEQKEFLFLFFFSLSCSEYVFYVLCVYFRFIRKTF